MLKRLSFLPSLALAAALALPGAVKAAPDADTVVARVNGEEITLGHMIVAHASLPDQYRQLPADLLYQGILDQLIQQVALGHSRDGEVPRVVRLQLENERRSLLAADALEEVVSGAVGDAEIQAAYEEEYADGKGGPEYNASHILVESEEEAKALIEALDGGADFAELAKEKSTGPSGPSGGELGWFGEGAMVPEFEAAVTALEVGQVSEPVQTQFGWHVVKLNDKRIADAPPLDEVREEIAGRLQQEAIEAHVKSLTDAAEIEKPETEGLSPELLRNLDLVLED